ncbi:GlxA family transcriptional regulator [Vibrio sp. nBUS_14]|uniref:GlxA family transcriptional regulator n=1 Tax=Vibrio sp. nBUS_14 TaxID=3395321 RepID=UPI003EB8591B
MANKRQFSTQMSCINQRFIPNSEMASSTTTLVFVLLEHFSLLSFTTAIDCLVTANLVEKSKRFQYKTVSIGEQLVLSDVGINVSTDMTIDDFSLLDSINVIMICGGLRTDLTEHSILSNTIINSARRNVTLGGIWNGSLYLAQAGILDDASYALHPDNHAYAIEHFPQYTLSNETYVHHDNTLTSSGPSSTLDMMLSLISQITHSSIANAVREILSCDRTSLSKTELQLSHSLPASTPNEVKEAISLMSNNLDELLSVNDIAAYLNISRRKLERIFQTHVQASPSKYYLELRLTYARQLLYQSGDSISTIAASTGFRSTTHFSRCFKEFFGLAPVEMRRCLIKPSSV